MSGFASRADEFRPSPVRAVFEVARDPSVVSLAGGNPDLSVLPADAVGDVASLPGGAPVEVEGVFEVAD